MCDTIIHPTLQCWLLPVITVVTPACALHASPTYSTRFRQLAYRRLVIY